METLIKNVPHAQPFTLKGQVEYEAGKVVSLTLAQQAGAGITLSCQPDPGPTGRCGDHPVCL